MANFYLTLILLTMIVSIDATAFQYFHCKAATCHEFYYGLRNFSRRNDYVNVCYDTVNSLQHISEKYGKCFDERTNKLNPSCIHALAKTMKTCENGLRDVPGMQARYYCAHRLMQNCAKHVGLERFPYNSQYQQLDEN